MTVAPLPDPPASFSTLSLVIEDCTHDWYRIYEVSRDPAYFGKTGTNRYDAPAGEFGVMYVAEDPQGAFIETLGRSGGVRVLKVSDLKSRALARLHLSDPGGPALRVVDLTGPGLSRLGLDARISTDADYGKSQQWVKAIHEHPGLVDGVKYRSRHDPSRACAAVFERSAWKLAVEKLGSLADPANEKLLGAILDTYDFGLA